IFDVNVKLYVPNHMGLRNPVFANVISIVEYVAKISDIHHIAKSAVTGEALEPLEAPSFNEPQYNEPNKPTSYDHYDYEDEESNGGKVTDKIKGFFSNIFD